MVFETKEQIIRRKKMAKYHLRALVRKARLNAYWLSELEDLKLGDDALKNITIIMRRPPESLGILTIHDKTILKRPHAARSKEEVAHLVKLFDELPCFKTINPVAIRL